MPRKGEFGPIPHGTYPGYRTHKRRGIPLDEGCGCAQAQRDYQSEQRKRLRELKRKNQFNDRVRSIVMKQLTLRHPAEARLLTREARQQVKLEMAKEQAKRNNDILSTE